MSYEQLDLFDLTEVIKTTAARIADGEVVNADDKLDLAEQMAEARRRMPGNVEYGAWWRTVGVKYSRAMAGRARRCRRTGSPITAVPLSSHLTTAGNSRLSGSRRPVTDGSPVMTNPAG